MEISVENPCVPNIESLPSIPFKPAATAFALGDLASAERLLEREHDIMARDNPDSLETLQMADALGEIRLRMQNPGKAVEVLEPALETCELSYGNGHAGFLKLQNNLGCAHVLAQEGDRAVELLRHTSGARTMLLGPDHPLSLNADNNLACAYVLQKKLADAEKIFVRVVSARERDLGEDHFTTVVTRANLAHVRMLMSAS
ncbi:MAG: tetratricopeptide repeat protein [Deltaproteobacteria bacterium]|jgi:tetratricopeptide (TPR) repeat protein|nr:tetratricopeptide repeat protein [Deltaproteobacteria bacterium]